MKIGDLRRAEGPAAQCRAVRVSAQACAGRSRADHDQVSDGRCRHPAQRRARRDGRAGKHQPPGLGHHDSG